MPRCSGEFADDQTGAVGRQRRASRGKSKSWLPKFTRSAIDCFRSSSKEKSKNSKIDTRDMAEMYYNALQSELRISNPYLYDGTETPNAEIYRQSWKLEPFPALPQSQAEKRRRCRSESNVARNSLLVGGHVQRCPMVADDLAQKKNWLRESKMKLEEMFKRKCRLLSRKRTSSLGDVHKRKHHETLASCSKQHNAEAKLSSTSIRQGAPIQGNGVYLTSLGDYADDSLLDRPGSRNSDSIVWRQKLERWAASLQCAIQVIKREENLRLEITQLRMHRELLERQLEEISFEKERWRRKCLELQKEKRRSVEGLTCQQCGGVAFQFGDEKVSNLASGPLLPITLSNVTAPLSEDAYGLSLETQRRDLDDDIFNALHDLILYYA